MKKKVCFVTSSFPCVSETFVVNHVLQAKLQGYDIQLLVDKKLSIDASSQKALLSKHAILNTVTQIDYAIPRSKLRRRFTAFIFIIKYLKYWLKIKEISFRKRFSTLPFQLHFYKQFQDIAVFHVQFAIAGLELAKMKSVGLLQGDVITTFHGYDAHYNSDETLGTLKARYQLLLKHSKYVTVNTPYLAERVNAIMPVESLAKVVVIPMGIDLDFFNPKYGKDLEGKSEIKLLSVGRLIELKGFTYAIQSVRKVIDMGFSVSYTIVGSGAFYDELKALIISLKLNNYVFLVGAKNQKEIKDLFESHDIFLMSSVADKTQRREAQGVVTAEAQAMGLPVVAFNNGGVPYTISPNETGVLVPEKNIEAYAMAIVELLKNPNTYRDMHLATRGFISANFCTTTLAKRFFSLYEGNL